MRVIVVPMIRIGCYNSRGRIRSILGRAKLGLSLFRSRAGFGRAKLRLSVFQCHGGYDGASSSRPKTLFLPPRKVPVRNLAAIKRPGERGFDRRILLLRLRVGQAFEPDVGGKQRSV